MKKYIDNNINIPLILRFKYHAIDLKYRIFNLLHYENFFKSVLFLFSFIFTSISLIYPIFYLVISYITEIQLTNYFVRFLNNNSETCLYLFETIYNLIKNNYNNKLIYNLKIKDIVDYFLYSKNCNDNFLFYAYVSIISCSVLLFYLFIYFKLSSDANLSIYLMHSKMFLYWNIKHKNIEIYPTMRFDQNHQCSKITLNSNYEIIFFSNLVKNINFLHYKINIINKLNTILFKKIEFYLFYILLSLSLIFYKLNRDLNIASIPYNQLKVLFLNKLSHSDEEIMSVINAGILDANIQENLEIKELNRLDNFVKREELLCKDYIIQQQSNIFRKKNDKAVNNFFVGSSLLPINIGLNLTNEKIFQQIVKGDRVWNIWWQSMFSRIYTVFYNLGAVILEPTHKILEEINNWKHELISENNRNFLEFISYSSAAARSMVRYLGVEWFGRYFGESEVLIIYEWILMFINSYKITHEYFPFLIIFISFLNYIGMKKIFLIDRIPMINLFLAGIWFVIFSYFINIFENFLNSTFNSTFQMFSTELQEQKKLIIASRILFLSHDNNRYTTLYIILSIGLIIIFFIPLRSICLLTCCRYRDDKGNIQIKRTIFFSLVFCKMLFRLKGLSTIKNQIGIFYNKIIKYSFGIFIYIKNFFKKYFKIIFISTLIISIVWSFMNNFIYYYHGNRLYDQLQFDEFSIWRWLFGMNLSIFSPKRKIFNRTEHFIAQPIMSAKYLETINYYCSFDKFKKILLFLLKIFSPQFSLLKICFLIVISKYFWMINYQLQKDKLYLFLKYQLFKFNKTIKIEDIFDRIKRDFLWFFLFLQFKNFLVFSNYCLNFKRDVFFSYTLNLLSLFLESEISISCLPKDFQISKNLLNAVLMSEFHRISRINFANLNCAPKIYQPTYKSNLNVNDYYSKLSNFLGVKKVGKKDVLKLIEKNDANYLLFLNISYKNTLELILKIIYNNELFDQIDENIKNIHKIINNINASCNVSQSELESLYDILKKIFIKHYKIQKKTHRKKMPNFFSESLLEYFNNQDEGVFKEQELLSEIEKNFIDICLMRFIVLLCDTQKTILTNQQMLIDILLIKNNKLSFSIFNRKINSILFSRSINGIFYKDSVYNDLYKIILKGDFLKQMKAIFEFDNKDLCSIFTSWSINDEFVFQHEQ